MARPRPTSRPSRPRARGGGAEARPRRRAFVRRARRAPARAEPARARARAAARVPGRNQVRHASRTGDRARLARRSGRAASSRRLRHRYAERSWYRRAVFRPWFVSDAVALTRRGDARPARRSARARGHEDRRPRDGRRRSAPRPRRDLVPALVLWGARDPQLPLDDAFEYARRLGARLRLVADCGHLVIVERPAAVPRRACRAEPVIALRRLREDEYEAWDAAHRAEYGRGLVEHVGMSREQAEAKVERDVAHVLPDGPGDGEYVHLGRRGGGPASSAPSSSASATAAPGSTTSRSRRTSAARATAARR